MEVEIITQATTDSAMSETDNDGLLDAPGAQAPPLKTSSRNLREERIILGFEDILRFHQAHGRIPLHGEGRDTCECLYAVRLELFRRLPEARTLLSELDAPGLLSAEAAASEVHVDDLDEDALPAELRPGDKPLEHNDVTVLRHLCSSVENAICAEASKTSADNAVAAVSRRSGMQ